MRKRSGLLFLVIGAALLLFLVFFSYSPQKKSSNSNEVLPNVDTSQVTPAQRKEAALREQAGKRAEQKAERKAERTPARPVKQNVAIDEDPGEFDNLKKGGTEGVEQGFLAKLEGEAKPRHSTRSNRKQVRRKPKAKPAVPRLDDTVTVFDAEGPANKGGAGQRQKNEKKSKERAQKPRATKKPTETTSRRPRRVRSLREREQNGLDQAELDAISGAGKDGKKRDLLGKLGAARGILDKDSAPTPDPFIEWTAEDGDASQRLFEQLFGESAPEEPQIAPRTKMTETSVDPKSTFSIDVDTGSYTLARARMREGYPPKKDAVRVEEFVNYFHYDYPEPVDSEFAIALEASPDPLSTHPRRHLVRIGVQGKSVPTENRPPAHLTFLVDVSGSMFGPDQLGLVIESLDLVTRNLRPEDTIAIVEYATEADVTMWPAGASERDIISRTIATLQPGGSSALDKGLSLAYEVASTHYVAGHINRVVLLGDGRANAGETRAAKLLESVRYGLEDGVELSTIGFGAKSFNDRMMEQLADRGNGAYYFVDSYREAQKVFGDYLCGTLFTIAKDVKIQVDFNPKSVVRHRLLGYENRELKHHQFRDDSVDAGEIGAGHSVTAIYEVDLTEQPDTTIASVSVRYKKPDEGRASELNFQLFSEEIIADVRQASADFKFAAAVAMYAEVARGTMPSDEARISLIREIAGEGTPRPDEQPDRAEFLALVDETAMFFVN